MAGGDTRPAARHYHDMVYDSESDRIVLFGGWAGGQTNETWAYDYAANEWIRMNPSAAPSPRDAFAMAYDGQSDRVILFGGATAAGGVFGDTWVYDLNGDTWTNMVPATSPPGRLGTRMAYDANADRTILFGGHNAKCYGDTWAYDLESNAWTEMAPTSSPSSRAWEAMDYDVQSQRIVMFGGDPCSGPNMSDDFNDTWTYDLGNNTWREMTPVVRPTTRGWGAFTYDTESDLHILFGGSTGSNETWTYRLDTNTWAEMAGSPSPSSRNAPAMSYDLESDRVVLFGGSWPLGFVDDPSVNRNNETWAYDFNANTWAPLDSLTLPRAPRTLEASPTGGVIELSWSAPSYDGGYAITNYRIYRGTMSGNLAFLAEVASVLTNADSQAEMATTYYYQVSAVTVAGESLRSEEVSATLPDSEDPTIAITSVDPTVGFLTALVNGTASDNVALERVELSTDRTDWKLAAGTSSWSGLVSLECGDNTIYARATDTSGNMAEPEGLYSLHLDCPGPLVPWLAILAIVSAAGGGVAIALLLRRRRSRR